jgi:hypothetical protein
VLGQGVRVVITDLKIIVDRHEERTLTGDAEGFRKGENKDKIHYCTTSKDSLNGAVNRLFVRLNGNENMLQLIQELNLLGTQELSNNFWLFQRKFKAYKSIHHREVCTTLSFSYIKILQVTHS